MLALFNGIALLMLLIWWMDWDKPIGKFLAEEIRRRRALKPTERERLQELESAELDRQIRGE